MVGARGLEPPTPRPPGECATQISIYKLNKVMVIDYIHFRGIFMFDLPKAQQPDPVFSRFITHVENGNLHDAASAFIGATLINGINRDAGIQMVIEANSEIECQMTVPPQNMINMARKSTSPKVRNMANALQQVLDLKPAPAG